MEIKRLYLFDKFKVKILKVVDSKQKQPDKCFQSIISREAELTYAHCSKLVKFLIGEGLLTTEKSGRICYLKLTDRGKKIVELIKQIEEIK